MYVCMYVCMYVHIFICMYMGLDLFSRFRKGQLSCTPGLPSCSPQSFRLDG